MAGAGRWLHWEMPMMADTDFLGNSMEWSVTWMPILSASMRRQNLSAGHRPVSVARRKAPYRFLPVLCSFLLDEPVHLVCQMLGGGSGRCIQKKTPYIVS